MGHPGIERVLQLIWAEDCRARVQLAGRYLFTLLCRRLQSQGPTCWKTFVHASRGVSQVIFQHVCMFYVIICVGYYSCKKYDYVMLPLCIFSNIIMVITGKPVKLYQKFETPVAQIASKYRRADQLLFGFLWLAESFAIPSCCAFHAFQDVVVQNSICGVILQIGIC